MGKFKVKPLNWHTVENWNGAQIAETNMGGYYTIQVSNAGIKSTGSFDYESQAGKFHSTVEKAKEYCQIDFENRVSENLL